jgi:hypothetical protein
MPKWVIHNKWVVKLGINKETSRLVNLLVDFPDKCQEFLDFCEREPVARVYSRGRPTSMTVGQFVRHDGGRSDRATGETQLKFLYEKGEEYVKAYYLHHIMDYIEWWFKNWEPRPIPDIENILKHLDKKASWFQGQEWLDVKAFVLGHCEQILDDCKFR